MLRKKKNKIYFFQALGTIYAQITTNGPKNQPQCVLVTQAVSAGHTETKKNAKSRIPNLNKTQSKLPQLLGLKPKINFFFAIRYYWKMTYINFSIYLNRIQLVHE